MVVLKAAGASDFSALYPELEIARIMPPEIAPQDHPTECPAVPALN
jgi:hypothetical protein